MLRNDLITLLADHDNDTVVVDVNGIIVDIVAVATKDGGIILRLDPKGLAHALDWVVSTARVSPVSPPATP